MTSINELYQVFLNSTAVVIDTRKITAHSLFIALKGDRFDGNIFAKEALSLGASAVVIDNPEYYIDNRTILVADCLVTLQHLASYHRNQLTCPIIALTGSNGKTTSKELINVVLSQKYRVKATVGNLNNHIGVPLTLLSFSQTTEIGIVEMGANHQKEIEFLCKIAKPDYGYITNFGKAHLEGFGGVEGVIAGKSEMYSYLIAHSKTVFINLDDPLQVQKTAVLPQVSFSKSDSKATVVVANCSANPFVKLDFEGTTITSHLIGLYNVTNICIALTVGRFFDVSTILIKEAIEHYVPDNNRSQLISKNSNKIILDAYNANPSSMIVALDNFMQINDTNKVLIVGDMFELGDDSHFEHNEIVKYLAKQTNMTCYFIGSAFFKCKFDIENHFFYNSFDDFSAALQLIKIENSTILIKGSRGVALERTLDFL